MKTKNFGTRVKLAVNLGEGGVSVESQQPISRFFKPRLSAFEANGGISIQKMKKEKVNSNLGCYNFENKNTKERFGDRVENVGTGKAHLADRKQKEKE